MLPPSWSAATTALSHAAERPGMPLDPCAPPCLRRWPETAGLLGAGCVSTGRAGGTLSGRSQGASDFPREHRLPRGRAGPIPKRPRATLSAWGMGGGPHATTLPRPEGRRDEEAARPCGSEGRRGSRRGVLPSACARHAACQGQRQHGGQGSSPCGQRLPGCLRC